MRASTLRIYREGGSRAFLKGAWSPVLGNIPINALYIEVYSNSNFRIFSGNGLAKRFFEASQTNLSESTKLYLSGCFAGSLSLVAFVPSEVIKIRIQDMHIKP